MNVSSERLREINSQTGFNENIIEKAIHLEELLRETFRHPYLQKRLLLKGGTALNFCCFNKPRLSVDVDFNYVGGIDIETMKKERPIIEEAIMRIAKDKGYTLTREPGDEHAGGKWRFMYKNVLGDNQTLECDISYLYRVPIGPSKLIIFKAFRDSKEFEIYMVSKEELFAGKVVAALERVTARDLYDLFNIVNYPKAYDKSLFRKAVILLGASKREDFRKIKPDRLSEISDREIKNTLYPLLHKDKRISRKEILDKVNPFLSNLLDFSPEEKEFLDSYLDKAIYRPDILFKEDQSSFSHIDKHPAMLWKRKNVEEYLKRASKTPSP